MCCCTAADAAEEGRRWPKANSHLLAGQGEPFDPRSPNLAAGVTRTPYQGVAAGLREKEGAARRPEGGSTLGVGRHSVKGAFQPVRSSNNQVARNDADATGHRVGVYGSAPADPGPSSGHITSGSL